MASVVEAILARVKAVLLAADTAAGTRIERGRDDAWSPEEFCAINIRRTEHEGASFSDRGDQHLVGFDLQCFADGDDWESEADALHEEAHAALFADPELATLGKGLRLVGTTPESASEDRPVGRITARYRIKCLTRSGDLARVLT